MWCPFPGEEALARDVLRSGVGLVGFLFEVGDTHAPGEMPVRSRGILNVADKSEERLELFRRSVLFARATGAKHVAALVGRVIDDRQAELNRAADALRRACEITEPEGLPIVVEPLNSFDTPGYLLHDADEAAEFVRSLGRPGVRLLLDVYHVAREGGDPVAVIPRVRDMIGHVQIADSPGRGAPGTGKLDLHGVVCALQDVGYDGFIGIEYLPGEKTTEESLAWLPRESRSLPIEAEMFSASGWSQRGATGRGEVQAMSTDSKGGLTNEDH